MGLGELNHILVAPQPLKLPGCNGLGDLRKSHRLDSLYIKDFSVVGRRGGREKDISERSRTTRCGQLSAANSPWPTRCG